MAWDPWRELERRPRTKLIWRRLPPETGGAALVRLRHGSVIFIDPELPREERTSALAHELVHDDRGGSADAPYMPPQWRPCVHREERRVDVEVARRLVPLPDLEEFVQGMLDIGLGVGPAEVGEQFDVCHQIAEIALSALKNGHRRYVA